MSATKERSGYYAWYDAMQITVPEAVSGDVKVRRFEVTEDAAKFDALRSAINGHGRHALPGTYTGLYRRGYLWMSDTPDERVDHMPALYAADRLNAERVLVNGLGLGMVLAALLTVESVRHIDVVEIDPDVVALVGPHYADAAREAGKTVTLHTTDAYAKQWPRNTTWDVAWHDVWADLCTDNLTEMTKLHRRYGRRVLWQGSWGRGLLERTRRQERRQGWHR